MNLTDFSHIQNYIGGEFLEPISKQYMDNMNPATGETFGKIPNSNFNDVDIAVKAAQKAFATWSVTTTETRFKILNR
jgi:aminomuconate-semialdehyde/2-hydroxymuconate-6-semialdehyde dehydrogenase